MGGNPSGITYQGYRTRDRWEVVVKRPGRGLRLLELPRREDEWGLNILRDYLGDADRAEDLHRDFAGLTLRRFTTDWELSESDIENALAEIEVLRARWRIALARG